MEEDLQSKRLDGEYQAIDQRYRRQVMVVESGPLLRQILFSIWIAILLLIGFFSVVVVGGYIVSGSFSDKRQAANLLSNLETIHAFTAKSSPVAVEISQAKALASGGKYDFLATVKNPNSLWSVEFDYRFIFDSGSTPLYSGVLNPGEERYVAGLSVAVDGLPRNPRLVIERVRFSGLSRHEVSDPVLWLKSRSNFVVSNQLYVEDIDSGSENLGQTDFLLANKTAYSYWEPKFLVLLLRSGQVIGVNEITVPEFKSGEERAIQVRWFADLPSSASILVIPMINYADSSLYMRPGE